MKMNTFGGKQNSFTEVQPLQGHNVGTTYTQPTNANSTRTRAPYFADPLLVPRVEKYLSENHDLAYVNIDHMVSELQKLYREYSRKKRNAFQALVQKAFDYIVQKNGSNDVDTHNSSDGSVDLNAAEGNTEEGKVVSTNRANDQLVSLYGTSQGRKGDALMEVDKELINISSDEENELANLEESSRKSDMIKNRMPNISIVPITTAGSKRPDAARPADAARVDTPRVDAARVDTNRRIIGNKRFDENISIVPLRTATQPQRGASRGAGVSHRGVARGSFPQPLQRGRRPSVSPAIGRGGVKLPSSCFLKFETKNAAFPPVPALVQNAVTEPNQFPLLPNRKRKASEMLASVNTTTPIEKTPSTEKKRREVAVRESTLTLKDFGGYNKVLEDVCKLLMHIRHPEVYHQIGVTVPRGFLLHGPPGCGKTLLAEAIAGELQVPMLRVAGPELIGGISGESEERIRDLFDQAISISPCILFIDEVDAITPNRLTAQREMERRIVAQLLACMDDLSGKENGDRVLVIGATNRPDSIDPALRRAGRFDREVSIGIPDVEGRIQILGVLCNGLKLSPVFDFEFIARNTPGYVGADLLALVREAAMAAVNRVFFSSRERKFESDDECNVIPVNGLDFNSGRSSPALSELISWLHEQPPLTSQELIDLHIEMVDFKTALKSVQPSAKREGFATVPDVTWDDIGSLEDIREELQMAIIAPVKYPMQCASLGLHTPTGVLLFGPPGCGKTLLAKAVANEAGINFISVKGPELLNMYVGESERAVRQCFQRAKNSTPCVIFFDELDSLCPKRSDTGEGASMRVVNQMLTEMDGIDSRKGVYLMAASNRPDIIDPAVLRPGRLDKLLYVGLPTPDGRVDILRAVTKDGCSPCIAEDVSFEDLAYRLCIGYTGADIAALVREASLEALREFMVNPVHDEELVVTSLHFDKAALRIRPSVPRKDLVAYEKLRQQYSVKFTTRPKQERVVNCNYNLPRQEISEHISEELYAEGNEEVNEDVRGDVPNSVQSEVHEPVVAAKMDEDEEDSSEMNENFKTSNNEESETVMPPKIVQDAVLDSMADCVDDKMEYSDDSGNEECLENNFNTTESEKTYLFKHDKSSISIDKNSIEVDKHSIGINNLENVTVTRICDSGNSEKTVSNATACSEDEDCSDEEEHVPSDATVTKCQTETSDNKLEKES